MPPLEHVAFGNIRLSVVGCVGAACPHVWMQDRCAGGHGFVDCEHVRVWFVFDLDRIGRSLGRLVRRGCYRGYGVPNVERFLFGNNVLRQIPEIDHRFTAHRLLMTDFREV